MSGAITNAQSERLSQDSELPQPVQGPEVASGVSGDSDLPPSPPESEGPLPDRAELVRDPEGFADLSGEALPPVPVAGAYLKCSVIRSGVRCSAYDFESRPYNLQAVRAYVISGNPVVWQEVNFRVEGIGVWSVMLEKRGSFAIAFVDGNNRFLSDWIVRPEDSPANFVADPSFESYQLNDGQYFVTAPAANAPWQVRKPANAVNNCSIAMLEIQSNIPTSVAEDGVQVAELNSDCKDSPKPAGPYQITLFQTLNVQPGHSYEIVFSYRYRAKGTLAVGLGSKTIAKFPVTDEIWQQFRTIFTADSGQLELSFSQSDSSAGGGGTLIDNVRAYDLGVGPKK